jgi:hypothetical protein
MNDEKRIVNTFECVKTLFVLFLIHQTKGDFIIHFSFFPNAKKARKCVACVRKYVGGEVWLTLPLAAFAAEYGSYAVFACLCVRSVVRRSLRCLKYSTISSSPGTSMMPTEL